MIDYPESFENVEHYLFVAEMDSNKKERIKKIINSKRSVAFLVTSNYEIYIGTTAAHKDLQLPSSTEVMEKGTISGLTRQFNWVVSDSQKDVNLKMEDLHKLQNAIKTKINSYLDLDYYLK